MVNDVDWRDALAALDNREGVDFAKAIIDLTGSSHTPVEWRAALVENLNNGFSPVDWKQALEAKYPNENFRHAIIEAMMNASVWILSDGAWNDSGVWKDSGTWVDA